jgi:hypothetical protein
MGRTSISSDGPELLASSAVESSCPGTWASSLVSSSPFDDAMVNFGEKGQIRTVKSSAWGFPPPALKDLRYPALW